MVIRRTTSKKYKLDPQYAMVTDCVYYWCKLNNKSHLHYTIVMNMKTYRINYEHDYYVVLTYHIILNKW